MLSFRLGASLMALVCLLPQSATGGEKEKLSTLSKITVTEKKDDVEVTLIGTRAPDFTSFTTSNPFGVVVDWAGSRIDGAAPDQKFARGLIRRIRTKQYDSEAERISRVTIELSRETTYHVEAAGTRVIIHFEPVADPIPEHEPKPEPVAKKEEPKELVYVPEGPLTEPDLPVPENPPPPPAPPVIAKVEPKKEPPPPQPVVAKVEPQKREEPIAKNEPSKAEPKPEPKADVVAKTEPKKAEPKPSEAVAKAEPKKTEPPAAKSEPKTDVAKAEPKKTEPKVEAKSEPVVAKAEPKREEPPIAKREEPRRSETIAKAEPKREAPKVAPAAKEEPKRIASYVPKTKEDTVRVIPPPPKAVQRTPPRRTNQIAASANTSSGWTPPGAGRVRGLPVVRYGVAQETILPEGETPVDPDEPATGSTGGGGGGDSDFDPGPRVMKYIGFRQMADVSRVFVRLDGKPKYKSKREGDTVVVELIDTSVPVKNNTRPLDTSYFNSPVGNVQAVPTGGSTRIEIKLKEQVPFQVKRIGTTIAIDFTRK